MRRRTRRRCRRARGAGRPAPSASADPRSGPLLVRPDAQSEAVEVHSLGLLRLLEVAAFQAELQEGPQAGRLAGVVVTVVVGVALEQPAPGAALATLLGFLLPPFQNPAHV